MKLSCIMLSNSTFARYKFFLVLMKIALRIHISNKKINIRIFSLKCVKFSLTCK